MSNAANVKAFQADLKKFAKVIDVNLGIVVTKIALDVFTRITKRTPVDTGRARASWAISQGSPSGMVPPVGAYGKKTKTNELTSGLTGATLGTSAQGSTASGDISGAEGIDGTKSVFVTTALDYVQFLEKGSSKQAPAGMVEIILAEVEVEIEFIIESAIDP